MPRKPKKSKPDPAPELKPLECPGCGCGHFNVVRTVPQANGRIRRTRECRHCGRQVRSYEGLA